MGKRGTRKNPCAPFSCLTVGDRVGEIDVLLVHLFLGQPNGLAEALEMDDLPLSEETDDIGNIRVVTQPQDVVIGNSCLLLGSQILGQVADDVALDGHGGGGPGFR